MTPKVELHLGDCLEVMRGLPTDSVDAVVTDPPAGIGFMGVAWDTYKGKKGQPRSDADWDWTGSKERPRTSDQQARVNAKAGRHFREFLTPVLAECLRIAKPGSVLLCWAIPRTSHWTGTAIEDAGWIIENRIAHVFGSGFPKHKSHLKPAVEDWWLARKPGPKWLGVEATRVATAEIGKLREYQPREDRENWRITGGSNGYGATHPSGRWPANLLLSHSPGCNGTCADDCPIRLMGEQGGERPAGARPAKRRGIGYGGTQKGTNDGTRIETDSGSAARFFPNFHPDADPFLYCPKASRKDRNAGCEGMEEKASGVMQDDAYRWEYDGKGNKIDLKTRSANHHPCVKPTALMRWLSKLACPPGGTILDPFMGSGSTGRGAVLEGFRFIGIEREPEYHQIAQRRIAEALESESKPVSSRPQNKGK